MSDRDLKPASVRCYFFGVWNDCGHFWRPAARYPQDQSPYQPTGCPWGDRHVDAILCRRLPPKDPWGSRQETEHEQVEGLARLHHKDGWTALAYWDRSGPDKRMGCNSNFVAEGTFTFEQMMEMARYHFPHVIERTKGKFEIRLEKTDG